MALQDFEYRKIAQGDSRYKEILALRYQVYCEERGFENPEDCPDGLERDAFDDASIHFAAIHRSTGRVIGTVRLVLREDRKLPGEQLFDLDKIAAGFSRDEVGEISRLALAKRNFQEVRRNFRQGGEIVCGLFQCLAIECGQLGLTHLYAVMGRGLSVLLTRNGIRFPRIGPERDYHGLRAPYLGSIEKIVGHNPELYSLYRDSQLVAKVA